jgi:hypothetical protein
VLDSRVEHNLSLLSNTIPAFGTRLSNTSFNRSGSAWIVGAAESLTINSIFAFDNCALIESRTRGTLRTTCHLGWVGRAKKSTSRTTRSSRLIPRSMVLMYRRSVANCCSVTTAAPVTITPSAAIASASATNRTREKSFATCGRQFTATDCSPVSDSARPRVSLSSSMS